MNRRKFLSGSAAAAASVGMVGSGRRGRFSLAREADAQPAVTPYPVLVIMAAGGMDPAMQMVATPNGRFGNVTIANRLSGTGQFRETKTGIRYVVPSILPANNTQFAPHLEDVTLIRAIRGYTCHGGRASMWFGDQIGSSSSGMRFGRLPWASVLAAQLRKRVVVPRPVALQYWTKPGGYTKEQYLDFNKWGTQVVDPATVPDRILSAEGFFDSLSASGAGLPDYERQTPAYDLISSLDGEYPQLTQPEYAERFASANGNANDVFRTLSSTGPVWPPDPAVLQALGITRAQADAKIDDGEMGQMLAVAYQALLNNLSHVVAFKNLGLYTKTIAAPVRTISWDSHSRNVDGQIANGNKFWPTLGRFIALLKKTPSPIVKDGRSMFETTNIWIQSEMGRTIGKDGNVEALDGTGHWGPASSIFLGGRFKRGTVIGGFTPDFTAAKVNPTTGKPDGGIELRMNNAIATVMKAAGGDPTEFTKAVPVDAILDMSR